MDISKKLTSSKTSAKVECKYPVLPNGQNFVVSFGSQQSLHGNWQVVDNVEAPFYLCSRVFENGILSKRRSADHRRKFFEAEIYLALQKES
ncbi:hypothetical protein A1A1_08304 [Planococcus antarcticus DSM 14505]|uniref:Uncharacterized protein n=1 Tax=Planococcus antarcticus DSM 14505 TaxID=1185653 RepID=A0AA87ILL8_9BACL|nr:hypothetical protein [Planococcus antarcticus]EIM06955.1 hypothetical protein A1A1_08304 [Planococcus antarcticus DSM 14505]